MEQDRLTNLETSLLRIEESIDGIQNKRNWGSNIALVLTTSFCVLFAVASGIFLSRFFLW